MRAVNEVKLDLFSLQEKNSEQHNGQNAIGRHLGEISAPIQELEQEEFVSTYFDTDPNIADKQVPAAAILNTDEHSGISD